MVDSPEDIMKKNTEALSQFIAPLVVYKNDELDPKSILTGGTVFFAQTSINRFLITAYHVFEEINRIRETQEINIFLSGPSIHPFNIRDWELIDSNRDIDICTLQVPENFQAQIIKKSFFPLNGWPHPRARIGDKVMIVGFPSLHRTIQDFNISFRITPINDFVTDVGPRRFTMADETDERQEILNSENLGIPEHFGGMSGSPAFRLIENKAPEFIGVFSEGSSGLRGTFFNAHADFICENGTFNNSMIPPSSIQNSD